jgi:hypothetical protein
MLAPAFSVMSEPEVELVKPFTTFMSPVLSTRMLLSVMAETRSLLSIFAVPFVDEEKTPFSKVPCVGLLAVMLMVVATNEGSTLSVVPTYESEVKVSV